MSEEKDPLPFKGRTIEQIHAMMEANPPQVSSIHKTHVYLDWDWVGCGFGQLEVFLSEDGTLIIDNECMHRERVRKILHAWADFIADRALLRDFPNDVPPVDFEAEQLQQQKELEEWEKSHG